MNTNKEEKIVLINNNDILPNRFQPRKTFSENDLLDLTETIKKYGILEPIIVRPLSDKYELVAGERRYKANVLAGNDNIPSIIKNLSDAECAEIAIIENSQRQDLSPLEEAISYKRTIDLGYDTQQKLAEKIGKSQSYIANKIRLLKLSDEVQDALLNNKISERHARSLLKVNSLNQQNEMLNRIINERLTVRRTDEEIDKMNNEQLQTTPLNTIFNNENNSQKINENNVFSFGPEQPTTDSSEQPLMSFDLNGNPMSNNTSENAQTPIEAAPQSTEPQSFNMFAPTPEAAPMEAAPQSTEPQPFNMFAPTPEAVAQPTTEADQPFGTPNSSIPQTPIFNSSDDASIAEFKKPDPIIVTDYSKEYDPVMPQSQQPKMPDIDMKTIINIIRQCSDTIEKCGYTIETEEYDLENMYQVVFKINKN